MKSPFILRYANWNSSRFAQMFTPPALQRVHLRGAVVGGVAGDLGRAHVAVRFEVTQRSAVGRGRGQRGERQRRTTGMSSSVFPLQFEPDDAAAAA